MKPLIIVVLIFSSFYSAIVYSSDITDSSENYMKIRKSFSDSELAGRRKQMEKMFDNGSDRVEDVHVLLANLAKISREEEKQFEDVTWKIFKNVAKNMTVAINMTRNVLNDEETEHEENLATLNTEHGILVGQIKKLEELDKKKWPFRILVLCQLVKNGMGALDRLVVVHNSIIRYQDEYSE